jgi:hypothetical protein
MTPTTRRMRPSDAFRLMNKLNAENRERLAAGLDPLDPLNLPPQYDYPKSTAMPTPKPKPLPTVAEVEHAPAAKPVTVPKRPRKAKAPAPLVPHPDYDIDVSFPAAPSEPVLAAIAVVPDDRMSMDELLKAV